MALEEDISSDDDIARATTRWASKTVSDARKTIREAVEELRSTGTTSIPAFLRELFGPDFEFGATPLDVEITEEDFRNGSVKDPEQCPIAFALWRYFDEYAFLNRPTSIRGLAEEAELEYGEARVLNAALDPEVIVLLANHQDGRPISAPVSARIWLDTWSPK